MNPDPDFVLRGKSPSYWSKPGYLSNSQLTTTTSGVGRYSPECYHDNYDNQKLSQSLRSMSHNLNRVSSNLKQTLLGKDSEATNLSQSKDFHSSLHTSATEAELARLMHHNLDLEDSYAGRPRSREESQWYTSPVHMSQTYLRPSRSTSPIHNTTGTLGALLDEEIASDKQVYREIAYKAQANEGGLAATYFPVTLGAGYYMQAADRQTGPPLSSTKLVKTSPSKSRSNTGILKKSKRAKSAARADELLGNSEYRRHDNMHFLVNEAPTIASAVKLITVTPYQTELARLRMERLRMEEDRLLELKRQEELERIRGPKQKWYEMKTPEFHYEAHKNNQLIRSRDKWQDLLTYREELSHASDDFHRSWDSPLTA
ncbi:uncharacterized protein LOC124110339 [Haliotis rufescens]|uniref:uncharacterized protein LOC124110339 n=1 Tax=Haliotis rufescens TaxID=6454 RepID=UPI00201FAA2C|nr:uncharacterized protein LOC124110339 [Haliotis rufescens]